MIKRVGVDSGSGFWDTIDKGRQDYGRVSWEEEKGE